MAATAPLPSESNILSKHYSRIFIADTNGTVSNETCNLELKTEIGSRKRQRVDVEEEEREEKTGYKPSSYIRDPDFFVGDGLAEREIVVRVQDTLFKVPRKVLEQAKGLTLPNSSRRHDARNPWELAWAFKPRDTATSEPKELFRDLLWLLKAMDQSNDPIPLSNFGPQEDTEANRIFQVGGFVRDLGITHLTSWIADLAAKASQTKSFMDACSTEIFEKLYDIAHEAGDSDTKERLAKRWAARVFEPAGGGLPAVPAILFTEQYGLGDAWLRELKGVACYMHLVFNVPDLVVPRDDGIATVFRTHPKLNDSQRMQLLNGYFSLANFWQRFKTKPLVIPDPGASCTRHGACNKVWGQRWMAVVGWERISRIPPADVLGLIACLRDQLANDNDLKAGLTPGCRQAGLDSLTKKYDEVKAGLASHFTGV